jgi:glycosyltransferase involved in cell wall biosynthesis
MRAKRRLVFVQLDSFFPPAHGGAHMLRVLAEGLARLGHDVRVILLFQGEDNADGARVGTAQTIEKLRRLAMPVRESPLSIVRFEHAGVRYAGVYRWPGRFLHFVETELRNAGADAAILSDIGGSAAHLLLRAVHERFDGQVIYFPMTVHMLPAGPLAITVDDAAAALVKKCRVAVPSAFCARYLADHFGAPAAVCIPPMFAAAPQAPPGAGFGRPVALFNPNTWKGLPVLLGLADARPDLRFLVRCAWRTTESDERALRARRNIQLHHQAVDAHDTIYESASAVLAPSLCCESLGLVPIEAMLRGLPSLASDLGGLKEAALGLPFSLPVNPIVFHRDPADPGGRAREELPAQPLAPWLAALDRVTSDREFYRDLSTRARRTAAEFADSLSWETTEASLLG